MKIWCNIQLIIYRLLQEYREKGMIFWQTILKENFSTTPFLPTPLKFHEKKKYTPNHTLKDFVIFVELIVRIATPEIKHFLN